MLVLNWPWWIVLLILGVEAWPLALAIALGCLILAALTRGWVRQAALVTALPCLAVTAVAAFWAINVWQHDRGTAAGEDRVDQVLDRDAVVNSLYLPAGTAIRWRDTDHVQLGTAAPPSPIMLFGLHVSWIQLADDGKDWNLQLREPELVDGWTCGEIGVRVSATGQLRSCRLAGGRSWQGWPIPAGSFVDLATADKVELVLPTNTNMAAPEIDHGIAATGSLTINADGSLDRCYFEDKDPLLVAGRQLWNTVQWTYDPATYGQGRRRRPLTVHGHLVSANGGTGVEVVIRIADGQVTAAD